MSLRAKQPRCQRPAVPKQQICPWEKKTRVGSFWLSIRRLTIFRGTWRLYISKYIYIYIMFEKCWNDDLSSLNWLFNGGDPLSILVQEKGWGEQKKRWYNNNAFQRLGRANPYLYIKFCWGSTTEIPGFHVPSRHNRHWQKSFKAQAASSCFACLSRSSRSFCSYLWANGFHAEMAKVLKTSQDHFPFCRCGWKWPQCHDLHVLCANHFP